MRTTKKQARINAGLELLKEFDKAAQCWGWEADQGSLAGADAAKARYDAALSAMQDFIRRSTK